MTRKLALFCLSLLATLMAVQALSAGVAIGISGSYATPPNGIYTCAWIAANPTAATLAGYSCHADMVNPGSAVSPGAAFSTVTAFGPDSADANGCQNVGPMSSGVYGATTYEYANNWRWVGGNGKYHWYLQKTDGTYYVNGPELDDGFHEIFVPFNVYRWKVQNQGSNGAVWNVCYHVV
jgi:hypothetical protein